MAESPRQSKDSASTNGKPPRPNPLTVRIDGIPDELRERKAWVVWGYTWKPGKNGRPGKYDKPPLCAHTRKPASSTDPATWSTFDEAASDYQRGGLDGIGFVLAAGAGDDAVFVGVDLDKCRDPQTGAIAPWAQGIIDTLNTYAEASPSGTGVRLLLHGRLTAKGNKRPFEGGVVEVYETGRYVTITGQHLDGTPTTIEHRQAELLAVHRQVWPESHRQLGSTPSAPQAPMDLDEAELIRLACKNPKFSALWSGSIDGYPSQSEADQALCNKLAYWCQRDAGRMDAIFRQSGLYRKKWEREDYRTRTIHKAVASCTNVYQPRAPRPPRPPSRTIPEPEREEPETPATPETPALQLGPLTLQVGQVRRTPSKILVPVLVLREGVTIDQLALSSSFTGRKQVAQQLAQHLGADPAREQIDTALGQIIVRASQAPPAVTLASGPTIREIVARKIPEAMRFACRTKHGLWSETVGDEVRRGDLTTYTPTWLMDEAASATDAPRDDQGGANRPALLRAIQGELGVLWADLLTALPREADVNLGRDTEKGRQFRQALITLWKTPVTWETHETSAGETATRASLVSRVWSQSKQRTIAPSPRECWRRIHPACDAWWRPWIDGEGELRVLLAMRWTLMCQVKIALPGVTDEPSLTRLGERFGVLQNPLPGGVSARLSGGGRLGVLSLDLCEELLEQPTDDPEENPREPGTEG